MAGYGFNLIDPNNGATTSTATITWSPSWSNVTYDNLYSTPQPRRRRVPALYVAIGHAAFFLALAVAGWLR